MTAALVRISQLMQQDLVDGQGLRVDGATIADGDVPRINMPITVERGYVPREKAKTIQTGEMKVYISPNEQKTARLNRTTLDARYVIDVGLLYRLPDKETETIDSAMETLENVSLYHFDFGLSVPYWLWIENEPIAWPDRDEIAKSGLLFALWIATFEGQRKQRGAP